jgi:hypothetical protein
MSREKFDIYVLCCPGANPMPSAIAKLRTETKLAFGCVGLVAIGALVMVFNGAHK